MNIIQVKASQLKAGDKLANLAIAAEAERAKNSVIPTIVIDLKGGLVNVVQASHPMNIYIMDGDTEGCDDKSSIAKIDGTKRYLSNMSVSEDECGGAELQSVVDQIENHLYSHLARLEWLWPDQESNWTAATVDERTGIVTILDHSKLDEDYDDASVIQRIVFEDGDVAFEVEPFGSGEWRILPELLDAFVEEAYNHGAPVGEYLFNDNA